MRKIRFRYIKENGKSTSVTVRCSLKRNASLISEALRHYQRLERQNDGEILDKQNRRHYQHVKECKFQSDIKSTRNHHFDPIQLRRKQCSSTLIDEDIPRISSPSLSSGFQSNSNSLIDDIENLTKRSNIIKEIYKTEYDYLGHLKNLVDVYLKKMYLRTDLFTKKQIELLMGNIEDIYNIHQSFFQLLKLSINELNLYESLIGKCFLFYKDEFKKYSDYCINHPLSCLELIKLENNIIYRNFFETCRLEANMIELKFDAFLLTPIQRICQYPLQLNELLKYTSYEHKDYNNVQQAFNAMRDVANYINERKRQMEYIEIIHKWQNTVEDWQGKDLLETSTKGLGRANAYLYQNGKKESVILFLFDHVLIICKKDRRNILIYIGRVDLDQANIEDLIDGKDEENVGHLLFAWRLYDSIENKTYLFTHRTALDKIQMMDALEYERAYVEENLLKDFPITRLTTLKTEEYLMNQTSITTKSFPSITKQNRSISAILRTSNSPSSTQSSSLLTTTIDHIPVTRRKSSLPRFVRCSSPDSSVDDSFRSIKSRFRFWS